MLSAELLGLNFEKKKRISMNTKVKETIYTNLMLY